MAIYHIKKNGEPSRCKAFLRECPLGGPEDHYTSKVDAQKSFELRQGGSFGQAEKEALTLVEENDLRTIDAKLLENAKKMAYASGAELVEIEAITEPLAIIRAARVETIVELSVPELTPSYPRVSAYDAFGEAPD